MTTIGFIGLGIMGGPMAANLVEAGYDVVGYNRSRGKVDKLVERGGRSAGTVVEAVRGADVVMTMLPDSPDVEQVVLGEDGVLAHAGDGALLIDFSTIRPDVSRAVAERASSTGVRTLDAPVSGGEAGAVAGSLSIMVGGDAEAFGAAGEVLDVVGKTVVHVGPAGAGQTVKAANQLIVAGNIALAAEALNLVEAQGVDVSSAATVLAGGLAGSKVLDAKSANMIERSFQPGFRMELHHKDLGIVAAALRDSDVTAPVATAAAQLVAAAVAQGDGGLDHSALFKQILQLSGRK